VTTASGVKGGFNYTYLARMDYDKFEQKLLMDTGTGVRTTYAYDPANRRLANLVAQLPDGFRFQNMTYGYDNMGNVTQIHNEVPVPHGKPVGGPSTQTFSYDDLYQLTSASGEYRNKDNKLDRYSLTLGYDSIHNTTAKNQLHEIEVNSTSSPLAMGGTSSMSSGLSPDGMLDEDPPPAPTDPTLEPLGPIEEPEDTTTTETGVMLAAAQTAGIQTDKKATYNYGYTYGNGKPHAPNVVGPVTEAYDANGNLVDTVNTLPPAPGKRRQFIWDEENRLACNQDHNRNNTLPQNPSSCGTPQQPATVRYVYDDQGNRVIKEAGPQHIYPNRTFSERAGTGFKHIFVGDTRIATKTVKPDSTFENQQFYFHDDQLGSTGFVTDEHANLTQHLEYFAFGETWVDEHPAQPTPVPYQFGSKELDDETGLYYYGSRYYNPRTDLWQSPDPILGSYLDGAPNHGVLNSGNLALYSYTHNNPVSYTDPNGLWDLVGHQLTPQAAALAVGLSPAVARAIGVAAWAPDLDSRVATSPSSIWHSNEPNGHFQATHLLNGRPAAEVQRGARERFQQVVDTMSLTDPRFTEAQENILHGFGDSFAHVDLGTANRQGCPCMYGPPIGHGTTSAPDNPNTNQGQYRQYLEGLYDVLSSRAQRENLTPRMTRNEFVETMMRDIASQRDDARQRTAAQAIIGRMEAQPVTRTPPPR
jgi:RHS repeat-associated protein